MEQGLNGRFYFLFGSFVIGTYMNGMIAMFFQKEIDQKRLTNAIYTIDEGTLCFFIGWFPRKKPLDKRLNDFLIADKIGQFIRSIFGCKHIYCI
jgi:hypothetical protein